jgi:hypothetical protein
VDARAVVEQAEVLARMLGEMDVETLADDEFLVLMDRVGYARRLVDAAGVRLAGDAERRSQYGDQSSLARRLAMRSPAGMVAERVGIDSGEATMWCSLGTSTATRSGLQGQMLPAKRSEIAAALAEGRIAVGAAHRISSTLDEVTSHTTPDQQQALEATLVGYAATLTRRDLNRLCRTLPDRFDPDGAEPREEALRARAGLRVARDRNGLVKWIVTMDPESAGMLTTALDARTAPRRQPRFVDTDALEDITDNRPLEQRRLQALVDLARESIGRDDGAVAGAPVTMLVTVSLDALKTGLGTAQIAGIDEPISAATARRLAADADIIPAVLGTDSEILDLGRARRLATPAQRRALALRDGGCTWPGCEAPPGWCEVAHILAWILGGRTDLVNLILLCPFHHRICDGDGWQVTWRSGDLWFVPPPHVDPTRRPRRGGPLPLAA